MKIALCVGFLLAVCFHAFVFLFGGILFASDGNGHGTLQEVELLAPDDPEKDEKPQEPKETEPEEVLESETEAPPDAAEIIKNLEIASIDNTPALDAASLGAIEAALSGQSGAGDFFQSVDFSSGGRIGGTGKAGALDETMDTAFDLSDIDQKPRVVFQAAPLYPSDMRGKKVEAVVTVLFIVDSSGKVEKPRIESSTNPAFERPAMDAVKKWKFEPAVRGGERVHCRMRVPIRFQPN